MKFQSSQGTMTWKYVHIKNNKGRSHRFQASYNDGVLRCAPHVQNNLQEIRSSQNRSDRTRNKAKSVPLSFQVGRWWRDINVWCCSRLSASDAGSPFSPLLLPSSSFQTFWSPRHCHVNQSKVPSVVTPYIIFTGSVSTGFHLIIPYLLSPSLHFAFPQSTWPFLFYFFFFAPFIHLFQCGGVSSEGQTCLYVYKAVCLFSCSAPFRSLM